MKGAAGVVLLEHLRLTRIFGRTLRRLRLTWLAWAGYWLLNAIRGRAGRFVPEGPRPRRWP